MDLLDVMSNDAKTPVVRTPTNDELESIAKLAEEQLLQERLIESIEEDLANAKSRLANISENLLPKAMEAVGMSEFKLTTGEVISIKDEIYTTIKNEDKDAAFQWLEETGNDGIIKNEVTLPFGKGQDAESKRLLDLLNQHGYTYTNSRTVHHSTLKSFVKGQLEDGVAIPSDIFSIYPKKVAKIQQPKTKKR